MNGLYLPKTFIVAALAITVAAEAFGQTNDAPQADSTQPVTDAPSAASAQPAVPPPQVSALPSNIAPGSALADVVKMIQAGVEVSTIQAYIGGSQGQFGLDADKILFLNDEGAPSTLINAMMDRDRALQAVPPPQPPADSAPSQATPADASTAAAVPPPVPDGSAPPPDANAPAPSPDAGATDNTDMSPPSDAVDLNYFYDTLSPYGSWVNVDGYGQCWRPTMVMYDASWRPYCDRGHWLYTDYGWYWDSDYAWGATFHYGRWFYDPNSGWCWCPDMQWAPAWVSWRSDTDYCGWAPLPPFAAFTPGAGFSYRGMAVAADFDFGLGAGSFVFLSPAYLCARHPGSYVVASQYVPSIFQHTAVINNYSVKSKTIVNRGVAVDFIAGASHRAIQPIHISALPNAGRQGWRGEGYQPSTTRPGAVYYSSHGVSAGYNNYKGMAPYNGYNNANAVHYDANARGGQGVQSGGYYRLQPGGDSGRVQTQNYYNQQQQQPRASYNYGAPNPNYNDSQRGYGAANSGGYQQRGSEEFQGRQYVEPNSQPRQDFSGSGGRVYNQGPPTPPQQGQPQQRYQGNGGGGSGGGGSNSSGSNKQNH